LPGASPAASSALPSSLFHCRKTPKDLPSEQKGGQQGHRLRAG